jgi:hypothetical protein
MFSASPAELDVSLLLHEREEFSRIRVIVIMYSAAAACAAAEATNEIASVVGAIADRSCNHAGLRGIACCMCMVGTSPTIQAAVDSIEFIERTICLCRTYPRHRMDSLVNIESGRKQRYGRA